MKGCDFGPSFSSWKYYKYAKIGIAHMERGFLWSITLQNLNLLVSQNLNHGVLHPKLSQLVDNILRGEKAQILMWGRLEQGRPIMSQVISKVNKPTLVLLPTIKLALVSSMVFLRIFPEIAV